MKALNEKKVSDLGKIERTHGFFKFSPPKIPCENNCPYMVVTDTLGCEKEFEGLVDLEEVRETGVCPFWPHKDLETKGEGKNIGSS